ncbi:MAG: CreA family protein [Rhodospirillales bacterium]|jgi:CreA protein|nr:CreA family protein [Rhodospirillales bacterium]
MRRRYLLLLAACLLIPLLAARPAAARTVVGAVNTNFRWLGPDDKIVVERYDDPAIAGVSCYVSRAETGGVSGMVGLATDPSRFSIACRQTGPIAIPPGLPKKQLVFTAAAAPLFKALRVWRLVDRQKQVLVYLVVSTKLVRGSPYNSLSAVAYGTR